MTGERRIVMMKRAECWGPGKDAWFIPPAKRFRKRLQFEPERVPFVDAKEAWFEIERVRGGWNVLRQVEAPVVVTAPELDLSNPWPRRPRRLGECRRTPGGGLCLHCKPCGEMLMLRPESQCRAFDDWTVEELQRAGFWRCACGRVAAVSVYDRTLGAPFKAERWFDDCGWIRF